MTHSEKKRNRESWNVICVSQVSVATLLSAPLSSSTAMETINYPTLTNLHHHFYGQPCSRQELPSWECPAGTARIGSKRKNRSGTGEMWPGVTEVAKGWASPPWSGMEGKNPSPSCFICNSWSQGEPGHLKSMERCFLGFMFAGLVSWLTSCVSQS